MNLCIMLQNFSNDDVIETMQNKKTVLCDISFLDRQPKDILKAVQGIKRKQLLDSIAEDFCSNGLTFFSCVSQLSYLKENVLACQIQQYQNSDKISLIVPLAPILGLPNVKPQEELRELAGLLNYFRDKAKIYPENNLGIQLYRGWGERGIDILCKDKDEQMELQKTLNHMIDTSQSLTAWKNNQMQAIKNTSRRCNSLFSTTLFGQLLKFEEQLDYFKASRKPEPFIHSSKRVTLSV